MVVRDTGGYVFGVFTPLKWEQQLEFYGSGETFLFTFGVGEKIKTFKWTAKNSLFMYSDSEGLGVGAEYSYSWSRIMV
jgi:hypothetical protein